MGTKDMLVFVWLIEKVITKTPRRVEEGYSAVSEHKDTANFLLMSMENQRMYHTIHSMLL